MIYYVEDDENIRELVIYTLKQASFEACGFDSAQPFYDAVSKKLPELVLLDVMLPGEDGISVLKKLRKDPATMDIPVIMLSAKGTEYDKVTGLDIGADDYIAKPFGMAEFMARAKAVLRRSVVNKDKEDQLSARNIVVDEKKHRVFAKGSEISLTHKEYKLLYYLMRHIGQAFTRDQLLEKVWGYDYDGGTRTVDVHIKTLRSKLGSAGDAIETIRGIGYRFGGDI